MLSIHSAHGGHLPHCCYTRTGSCGTNVSFKALQSFALETVAMCVLIEVQQTLCSKLLTHHAMLSVDIISCEVSTTYFAV
jgi:hypothetical protein